MHNVAFPHVISVYLQAALERQITKFRLTLEEDYSVLIFKNVLQGNSLATNDLYF